MSHFSPRMKSRANKKRARSYLKGSIRKADYVMKVPSMTKPVRRWWEAQKQERPFAAIASRKLRWEEVCELIDEIPPSMVLEQKWRTYLFRTGEDRDRFVEVFFEKYHAKAASLGISDDDL